MKRKIATVIFRCVIVIFIGVIAGLGIYNIKSRIVLKNSMPMPFGIGTSVVISGSMEPELSVNDLIIVKETDDFEVGQVVVFQDGYDLVVHRIIKIEGDTVTTKGDANTGEDEPISKKDIKGEVVEVVPNFGAVYDILRQPLVTVGLIALSLFLMDRSFKCEKKSEKNELEALKNEIKQLAGELRAEISAENAEKSEKCKNNCENTVDPEK